MDAGMTRKVILQWAGRNYVVPEQKAFRLAAAVEDVVSLPELQAAAKRGAFRKIALAYAAMLKFAGATVTEDEVIAKMFGDLQAAKEAGQAQVFAAAAITQLAEVLMLGAPPMPSESADDDAGNG